MQASKVLQGYIEGGKERKKMKQGQFSNYLTSVK